MSLTPFNRIGHHREARALHKRGRFIASDGKHSPRPFVSPVASVDSRKCFRRYSRTAEICLTPRVAEIAITRRHIGRILRGTRKKSVRALFLPVHLGVKPLRSIIRGRLYGRAHRQADSADRGLGESKGESPCLRVRLGSANITDESEFTVTGRVASVKGCACRLPLSSPRTQRETSSRRATANREAWETVSFTR